MLIVGETLCAELNGSSIRPMAAKGPAVGPPNHALNGESLDELRCRVIVRPLR